MKRNQIYCLKWTAVASLVLLLMISIFSPPVTASAADLQDVKKAGVLRHLGIPYANFVTGSGDGMDVELIKLFAKHIGVKYEYVQSNWGEIFGDLTGKKVKVNKNDIITVGDVPIKGDLIANGLTVLPWREKIVNFSAPTFPNQVWLIARWDSKMKPIKPTGKLEKDIQAVKKLLNERRLLGKTGTCLDPSLYDINATGAEVTLFEGSLNDIAPAVINGKAELTLLDVPDALVALQKWPGKLKIIGPISPVQDMSVGFRKDSPALLNAFNRFLTDCRRDGTYNQLVKKYYPFAFKYFPEFFKEKK
jgi:ABC-type amino acid transport substrate-binding protein